MQSPPYKHNVVVNFIGVLFCCFFVFLFVIESVISIIDKKDNTLIIDDVIFDINATYKTLDGKILTVDLQCDDSRINESMMSYIEEAFYLLQKIFVHSLPKVKRVPIVE